jgi:nicotinate-nucleotide adenylyltransferase
LHGRFLAFTSVNMILKKQYKHLKKGHIGGRNYVGLMGGSFNPAHGGHKAISLFTCKAMGLSQIWWMVSPGNPLKADANDMAPLAARLASAKAAARGTPIKATAIETMLGTRYTVNTLRAIKRRYPRHQFVWMMGADNLRDFHKWRQWREIALQMPIAVIARPGYTGKALSSPAMAWFSRFVRPRSQSLTWTQWSTPALVILRFRPDPRSATAIRRADPHWHKQYAGSIVRDDVTHMVL